MEEFQGHFFKTKEWHGMSRKMNTLIFLVDEMFIDIFMRRHLDDGWPLLQW